MLNIESYFFTWSTPIGLLAILPPASERLLVNMGRAYLHHPHQYSMYTIIIQCPSSKPTSLGGRVSSAMWNVPHPQCKAGCRRCTSNSILIYRRLVTVMKVTAANVYWKAISSRGQDGKNPLLQIGDEISLFWKGHGIPFERRHGAASPLPTWWRGLGFNDMTTTPVGNGNTTPSWEWMGRVIPTSGNPEFLNSWFPEFLNSWFLDFLNSWIPELLISCFPDFLNSWIPDLLNSWIPEFLISRILEFKNSGIQDFRNPGIQEPRNSGIQEFRNSGIRELRKSGIQDFLNSWIPDFLNSWIPEFLNSWFQEFRNSRIQEFRTSGIQESRNPGLQELKNSGI